MIRVEGHAIRGLQVEKVAFRLFRAWSTVMVAEHGGARESLKRQAQSWNILPDSIRNPWLAAARAALNMGARA